MAAAGSSPAALSFVRAVMLTGALGLFSPAAVAGEILVGVAGPMSGPLAGAGKQILAAATLAAEDINAAGGLNGDRIRITAADDEASPAAARKAAQALAGQGVRAVIGHYNSAPTILASEIYAGRNILVVSPTAIVEKLTERNVWNVFRMAPRHDAQAMAAAQYMVRHCPAGKIAFAHDGAAFSKSLQEKAADVLKNAGNPIAFTAQALPGAKRSQAAIASIATRIVRSGIACIYWSGGQREAADLAKALHDRKSAAILVGGENLATRDMPAALASDVIQGLRMTVPVDMALSVAAGTIWGRLEKKLADVNREEAGPAIAAYAAMQVFAAGARANSSNDSRRIADALRSGKTFATIAGPVSFMPNGDRRETLYAVYRWVKAEDGKPIFVRDRR